MTPPKAIIISHVYSSDNKGDAALTSVLIQDLKHVFPRATITILKLEAITGTGYFEHVAEKPSFMFYALNKYHNPLFKLLYSLFMICSTLLWAFCLRTTGWHLYLPKHLRAVAKLYEQSDLIVPVGGGYIRSRNGIMNRLNIPLLLHPLLFGYLLGKPTVLYSQSVGPFQNRLETLLVTFIFKRMTLILLREDTSASLLESLGVMHNVRRAVDSGFLLRAKNSMDIHKKYHVPHGKLLVGVTVRSWLSGQAQTAYEQAVAGALDYLVQNLDAHIIFIPQVTAGKSDDDRMVSRRVHGFMRHGGHATTINDEPNHHDIKAIYNELDLLIGTRFHSVIFSLTSLVPVLAIEYEHKTSGIMHDLNLEEWVIKIEDVTTANLITLLQKLVDKQTEYRAHLQVYLPPYVHEAKQTIAMLQDSYYSAASQAITT